jgi:hypothetical protein
MDKQLTAIAEAVVELIQLEWAAQGHRLTGAFEEKITFDFLKEGTDTIINFRDTTDRRYGKIINAGVRPENIRYPFARARIEGLTNYAKLRMGASDKDAVSIAFAIATKHKDKGMPHPDTVAKYSTTGKRTQFVEDATRDLQPIIERYMADAIREVIQWQ